MEQSRIKLLAFNLLYERNEVEKLELEAKVTTTT
jgi:hypothetical protein